MVEIMKIENKELKEQIACNVLKDLPEWFGLPDSTAEYINDGKELPFWAASDNNKYVGFITLKETSRDAVEIHCMGVLKSWQRMGIGRLLFNSLFNYAKKNEYYILQVKTVNQGCYKEYDQTVAFYESLGFRKLEVFPTLWDEWNPCLIMVMPIQAKL